VLPRNSMAETTPVQGWPERKPSAYTRSAFEIVGIAQRNGSVGLGETLVVAPDRLTMVMKYSILSADEGNRVWV